jgi:hypothetical protein
MLTDPKSTKRHSSQQCRFTLLGPTIVKVSRKMMMKLTPGICNNLRGLKGCRHT